MEIVIIDEERMFAETVQAILEIAGFTVRRFSDATTALNWLLDLHHPPIGLRVLVDVALSPGSDEKTFDEQSTDKYLITGVVLCRTLFDRQPAWAARSGSFLLYSAHYTGELWKKVHDFADPKQIKTWQKTPQASGADIVTLIESLGERKK